MFVSICMCLYVCIYMYVSICMCLYVIRAKNSLVNLHIKIVNANLHECKLKGPNFLTSLDCFHSPLSVKKCQIEMNC